MHDFLKQNDVKIDHDLRYVKQKKKDTNWEKTSVERFLSHRVEMTCELVQDYFTDWLGVHLLKG